MAIDKELVSLLACPQCKAPVREEPRGFACDACRLLFSIEEGIPNFLISDAQPLTGSEPTPGR